MRYYSLCLYRSTALYLHFFFFFQAEDGIRDLTVTGVQTCALPISGQTVTADFKLAATPLALNEVVVVGARTSRTATETPVPVDVISAQEIADNGQIGRASCRERV